MHIFIPVFLAIIAAVWVLGKLANAGARPGRGPDMRGAVFTSTPRGYVWVIPAKPPVVYSRLGHVPPGIPKPPKAPKPPKVKHPTSFYTFGH